MNYFAWLNHSRRVLLAFCYLILVTITILFTSQNARAEISKEQFKEVTQALHRAYSDLTIVVNNPQNGVDIWWDFKDKRASYSSNIDASGKITHYLFFFGGLAQMSEMTPQGAALILCHELGHGIAGAPWKQNSKSSVEGQADFFATRFCLPKLLEILPIAQEPAPSDPIHRCTDLLCRHLFIGIQSDLAVIKANNPSQEAQFGHEDLSKVESVNTQPWYYPSNQCRLDTLIAGALEQERPSCWWSPTLIN